MVTLTAEIYTPRWGHEDTYKFEMSNEEMIVSNGPRRSKCVWQEGGDPVWKGESLDSHFRNDSIYAPGVFPDLLENLWRAWRNGELTADQAQVELDAIIEWLNALTRAKPRTDFWRKYF